MKPMGKRMSCAKTFRLDPDLVEDMLKCRQLARKEGRQKYANMTVFLTVALKDLIKRERGILEEQGIAWDHVSSNN